ncbi:MAG TPA: filamentous hemagglutinin N-terminal domain-containing protein, partial [Stenomitos sp.]
MWTTQGYRCRSLNKQSVLQRWVIFGLGLTGILALSSHPTFAQITPDATLGTEGSIVTPNVNVRGLPAEQIDGGAIRGTNLFHSFSEFNVGNNQRVYFANPTGIDNILTRVTGGNLSNILGTLGVDGSASLFLLNPNGIFFGPNAKLDIAGSFVASTANGVVFDNGFVFSANNPEAPPLLTINVPLGLQYGRNQPGAITNQGNLAVGSGQTLSLLGSTVTSTGSLTASGGTVQVLGDRIGLLDNALIDVSSDTGGGTVLIGGDFQGKGAVPNALRTFIAPNVTINANANISGNGGRVIVWADEVTGFYGNITARGGGNSGNGGFVEVSGKQNLIFRGSVDNLAANGNTGTLLLDPVNITIASGTADSAADGTNTFQGNNSGIAGSILSAPLSAINDTAPTTIYESELERLSGETNIVLQATNNITVNNLADNRLSFAPGRGTIAFTADADRNGVGSFVMQDTADTIETNGRDISISGASLTIGGINTSVSNSTLRDGAGQQLGTAQVVSAEPGTQLNSISGNLFSGADVDLYQIYVTGGSTFAATTVGGTNIDTQLFLFNSNGLGVYANDDLGGYWQATLPPGQPLTPTAPGIYYLAISSFNNDPVSNGGSIFQGFPLQSPTGTGGASPLTGWNNNGYGSGGNYTIFLTGVQAAVSNFIEPAKSGAITLTATNGSITARNLNSSNKLLGGDGGAITLNATGNITTLNINSSSTYGNGGQISITSRNGAINTSAGSINSWADYIGKDGGKITLAAQGDITLGNIDSAGSTMGAGGDITLTSKAQISAANRTLISDTYGIGKAGDISLTAQSIALTNNAALSASTFGKGNGGNISLRADDTVSLVNSLILSQVESTASGDGGKIEMTARSLFLADGAVLSSSTYGTGKAGNLTFVTDRLTVESGAQVGAVTEGGGQGGNLTVIASELVELSGTSSGLFTSNQSGTGNAGELRIDTKQLIVRDGAGIYASTQGSGDAGNLTVNASDLVQLSDTSADGQSLTGLFSQSSSAGNAGNLTINTRQLLIQDGAVASVGTTQTSQGRGGNLTVNATESVELSGASADQENFSSLITAVRGSQDAGNLTINTGRLTLRDGGLVLGTTLGPGRGGDVTINASDIVEVLGTSPDDFPSAVSSDTGGTGQAGDLTINTRQLTIRDGGRVGASTFNYGDAGTLTVNASELVELSGTSGLGRPSSLSTSSGVEGIPENPLIRESGIQRDPTAATGRGGDLKISTAHLVVRDGAAVTAATLGHGAGGNIQVQANSLALTNGAQVSAATSGTGRAGDISVYQADTIALNNSSISTSVNAGAVVNETTDKRSGNINLQTRQLSLTNGAEVAAATSGQGNAGSILVQDAEAVSLTNSSISTAVNAGAVGEGGKIDFQTRSLSLNNGAQVSAATSGTGRAGDISVYQADTIALNNSSISTSVNAGAVGEGGKIDFQTRSLSLNNGAQVSAATSGTGRAGDISVYQADTIALNNSSISSSVNAGAVGQGGKIDLQTRSLSLNNGAQVSAATSGKGQAGNISVRDADAVSLTNSAISTAVNVGAEGQGGDIDIQTRSLSVRDQARISANTSGEGKAGSITVTGNTLEATNGGQLLTSTASAQDAGNINLTIQDDVKLTGDGTGIFANTTPGSTGNGGSIFLDTRTLLLRDGAGIAVGSQGTGAGGNITAQSNTTTLDNRAFISAKTASNTGGNITLGVQDLLLLRRGSEISTTAGTAQAGGDGGNITISAGFILGIPRENSDITANAFTGRGGNINITTQGIFGLQFRPR